MADTRTRLPLPEPWADTIHGWAYTAEQMHAYSDAENAALRAELASTNERWEKSHQIALAIQDERDALRAEVAGLEQLVCDAAYTLEGARIWGGMEWAYNPLHPFKYRPMLDRLNVERARINDERAALAARKGEATTPPPSPSPRS